MSATTLPRFRRLAPAALLAILLSLGSTFAAHAQNPDWIEYVLQTLEEYNIRGGELVYGDTPSAPSYVNGPATQVMSAEGEQFPFEITEFYRYTNPQASANWWDAGPRWITQTALTSGDALLFALLARATPIQSAQTQIQITAERMNVWTNAGISQILPLTSDWFLYLIPFTVNQTLAAEDMQMTVNFGNQSQTLDVLAPVMINYGNQFTSELLQYLIDNDGVAPLLANFNVDAVRGTPPFTVNFDASISAPEGGISSFEWDFGDETTGSGINASHTYTEEGHYTVTLTIRNEQGESNARSRQIIVFDGLGLPETPLQVPFTAEAPTLDGQIDEAWDAAPSVEMQALVEGTAPDDESDLSATARVLWDSQNLYVLYEVSDQTLRNDSDNSYEDDAVDLYVDGGNEKTDSYDGNDAQYEFSYDSNVVTGNAVDNGLTTGVEYQFAQVSGGYVIEAKVPLDVLDIAGVPGTGIGLDFMVNDDDGTGGGTRQSKLAWFSLQDNAWQNLSGVANAVLAGGEGIVSAQFSADRSQILTDLPVVFDASASIAPGGVTGYTWDFGDGAQASGAVVEHTYSAEGAFDVRLTITHGGGEESRTRSFEVIDGTGWPEKPFRIPLAPAPPTIDGVLEAMWLESGNSVYLTRISAGAIDGESDLSATIHAMWDFGFLHIFYDVNDDVLNSDSEQSWQDDSPEFMLDGGYQRCEQCNDDDDRQYTFGLGHEELQGNIVDSNPDHGVIWQMSEREGGYTLEASIPWITANTTPAFDKLIGFEPNANDADAAGDTREARLTFYDESGDSYRYANTLGTAILVENVEVSISEPGSELPSAFSIESVYPNPFNPSTTAVADVRLAGEYEVRIYNVLGQLVYSRTVDVRLPGRVEVALEFGAYASGMYLIALEHKTSQKTATARAMFVK